MYELALGSEDKYEVNDATYREHGVYEIILRKRSQAINILIGVVLAPRVEIEISNKCFKRKNQEPKNEKEKLIQDAEWTEDA